MPPTPGKFAMTLEQIAQAENTTPAAINVLLSRAFKKLRRAALLCTAKELADHLEKNRREVVE